MAKHKPNNKQITPRLFSNELIEKLSHVHPSIPVIIYVPLITFFIYRAFTDGWLNTSVIISLFLGGVFLWTFMEYTLHRYVFHFEPKSKWGKHLHFLMHGIHHDYPKDPLRLVMPPAVSIPLALLTYVILYAFFGQVYTPGLFAGVVFGYLCYDMIHYATHHASLRKNKIGLWLKQHHLRHHYQDEHTGYGVSSPLWDVIMRTMPAKTDKESENLEKAQVGS